MDSTYHNVPYTPQYIHSESIDFIFEGKSDVIQGLAGREYQS